MKQNNKLYPLNCVCIIIFILFLQVSSPVEAKVDTYLLNQKLDQIMEKPFLDGALTSLSIRSATSGELVYDYNGDYRLKPASNMKILTAVAALSILGGDYCFRTELLSNGKVKWGILHGDLIVKGKGDPTLQKSNIEEMVQKLKKQGVKVIRGDLIGDDTWYDDVRYSIDLPWSDEMMGYGSAISALTVSNEEYDVGTVKFKVSPSDKFGEQAQIVMEPTNTYLEIVNLTNTVNEQAKTNLSIQREHGSNRIIIEGNVPINATEMEEIIAVWEPTEFALHIFKQSLKKHGIKLLGDISRGVTPEGANVLISHSSIPLSEVLIPFMKLSNNGYGEMLIKEIGKVKTDEGSWENGLDVSEQTFSHYGINTDTVFLRDGSGISHANLIPANEISKLLYSIQKEDWFTTFFQSLPVAGNSNKMIGGTLRTRMKNSQGRVRAKTGTLTTVSSISGYIETKSGETLIFSVLINNIIDNKLAKKLEDEIIMTLQSL
ncbi:D-alanyl-D-alanine carboxypeptidase/D-alanyl-D-alanine endopeptidase [Alkalihalobacterium elongatum]|uniref:D-alanyl-D-alanine carboxypeptidase/D-alanyl-D-alanine endopeptidase n=1 Tax=Alkalihalobacterium elongatum TaxID=2675466 RepID=UPI001C1FA8EC|nr:D-alanyl-D-alanine carboxypeptidase/D-alanyl-D-alanine-endopeptidase [Alkalihalobacterium elongatum]